jgi:hypothetical protein
MTKQIKPTHTIFTTRDGVERCTSADCMIHANGNCCLTPDALAVCHCPICDYWSGLAAALRPCTIDAPCAFWPECRHSR